MKCIKNSLFHSSVLFISNTMPGWTRDSGLLFSLYRFGMLKSWNSNSHFCHKEVDWWSPGQYQMNKSLLPAVAVAPVLQCTQNIIETYRPPSSLLLPPPSLPPSSCQNGPGQFCQLNSEYSKENGRMHPCTGCNPSPLFQLLPNSQMNWHCEFKRLVSIGDSQKPPRQPEQYWSL